MIQGRLKFKIGLLVNKNKAKSLLKISANALKSTHNKIPVSKCKITQQNKCNNGLVLRRTPTLGSNNLL